MARAAYGEARDNVLSFEVIWAQIQTNGSLQIHPQIPILTQTQNSGRSQDTLLNSDCQDTLWFALVSLQHQEKGPQESLTHLSVVGKS